MESVQSCDDNERFYHLRANTATLLILLLLMRLLLLRFSAPT